MMEWNDKQPIYQQLKDKIVEGILNGAFPEGEAIPSIRQVAEQYQLNPITVSKAYQMLVDDHILEKQRGLGMFVKLNVRNQLHDSERDQFIREEWPKILQRIEQLGLSKKELLK